MNRNPPGGNSPFLPTWTDSPQPLEDDDYARFLLSLEDGEALPEDDDDDPDFAEDLKRLLDELSDDECLECPAMEQQTNEPHQPDSWEFQPEGHMPSPLTPAAAAAAEELDGLQRLSPAWCTRSRYSLDRMDIEDLEGRLTPYVDNTTHDELPEISFNANPPEEMPPLSLHRSEAEVLLRTTTVLREKEKRKKRRCGPYITDTEYEKPRMEFDDVFPHELFRGEQSSNLCPAPEPNPDDLPLVMLVNTLNGPVRMRTDAWTPDMIMCLNRIMNAHTQLLIQSFTACLGMSHLDEVSNEMHSQLHSMYQMFQAQFNFDFGFDTMLRHDVPLILPPHERPSPQEKGKRKRGRKPGRRAKKRRQPATNVEEVIDLTEDVLVEDASPSRRSPLATVLDVPLMHVLPHLWQALMVISVTKRGALYGEDETPPEGLSKRLGYLPKLAPPKDVQRALRFVQELMTCGVKMPVHEIDRSKPWTQGETALLMYAVQLYREDFSFIKTNYLPCKDIRALERVTNSTKPDFDKHWKTIEATLMETDSVSVFAERIPERIERIQEQLCFFCRHFREAHAEPCPSRISVNPFQQESATVLKLLQGVVKNSALNLVNQACGDREMLRSSNACSRSAIENLMCVFLGQIGGQLAGSFDTLFTMMSVVAGMKLINDAEVNALGPAPDIQEIDVSDERNNQTHNERAQDRFVP